MFTCTSVAGSVKLIFAACQSPFLCSAHKQLIGSRQTLDISSGVLNHSQNGKCAEESKRFWSTVSTKVANYTLLEV